jgi:hypothetical protein
MKRLAFLRVGAEVTSLGGATATVSLIPISTGSPGYATGFPGNTNRHGDRSAWAIDGDPCFAIPVRAPRGPRKRNALPCAWGN